jgi:purine-nucleoside phosphorylase
MDTFSQAAEAAAFIRANIQVRPELAIVLGSGLGSFADDVSDAVRIPFEQIPHFCPSTAKGHAGQLVVGNVAGVPLLAMQGRIHLYEGYPAETVVFPTRTFAAMGIRAIILTNAAGAVNLQYGPGTLVAISDHINLQGQNPLTGWHDERLGQRFVDLSDAYCEKYRKMALTAARKLGIDLREGVYAGLLGPSYETPAEVRFLRAIGADLVGMSTVAEAIAARQLGMKVLAISCIANAAAGTTGEKISHEDVLEVGKRTSGKIRALIRELVPMIAEDLKR